MAIKKLVEVWDGKGEYLEYSDLSPRAKREVNDDLGGKKIAQEKKFQIMSIILLIFEIGMKY